MGEKIAVTHTRGPRGAAADEYGSPRPSRGSAAPPGSVERVGLVDALFGSWWIGESWDWAERPPCQMLVWDLTGDPDAFVCASVRF